MASTSTLSPKVTPTVDFFTSLRRVVSVVFCKRKSRMCLVEVQYGVGEGIASADHAEAPLPTEVQAIGWYSIE